MRVYLCRWQNGDFSVVQARDKMHAIELLDEVGGASEDDLTGVQEFMAHFTLQDDGEFELEGFGERVSEYLEKAYPALHNNEGLYDDNGNPTALMHEAVKKEKERLWPKKAQEETGEEKPQPEKPQKNEIN